MSINKVVITGNLTREPELKVTKSGTQILDMGVAVNDRRKNPQTGEWEDMPTFVECSMFGNRAEKVSHFLRKGQHVAIEGKLRYSSWEKDGKRHSELDVIVTDIDFSGGSQNQAPVAPISQPAAAVPPVANMYDEDIPF